MSLDIDDKIHRGKRLTSYELVDSGVNAHFEDGTSLLGRLLVGADGIHSRVRNQLQPEKRLLDTERQIIWARTWITPGFLREYPEDAITWFVGMDRRPPECNLILEPIIWRSSVAAESGGRLVDGEDYVYWSLTTETSKKRLREPDEIREFVESVTRDWNDRFKAIFRHADWNLAVRARLYSSRPDIGDFARGEGRVVIVGDAAHPMTPQGGLGGNTAVKGAADLCRAIVEEGVSRGSMVAFEGRLRGQAEEAIEISFKTAKFMVKGKDWWEYSQVDGAQSGISQEAGEVKYP